MLFCLFIPQCKWSNTYFIVVLKREEVERGKAFGTNRGEDSDLHLPELQNDHKAALPFSLPELGLESPVYQSCPQLSTEQSTLWIQNVWTIFQVPCQLAGEMILLLIHLNTKTTRQRISKICFSVSNYLGTMISLLSEAQVRESFITEPSMVLACALSSGHRWMKYPLATCNIIFQEPASDHLFWSMFPSQRHGLDGTEGCEWLFCTLSEDHKQWDNLLLFHSTPESLKAHVRLISLDVK